MQLLAFAAIALFAFMIGFALDLGGAVCAMIFLLILFTAPCSEHGTR